MSGTQVCSLCFHTTHGRNVKLSADTRLATRLTKHRNGVCYSNQPVAVNEQLHIEIKDTTEFWYGVLRLGFTNINPATIKKSKIPHNMSAGMPGYWATEVAEKHAKKGSVWTFYVTPAGDVHFAVCGFEDSKHFSGFDLTLPMWAVIDIYGKTTAVEILGVTKRSASSAVCRPLLPPVDVQPRPSAPQARADECVVCMDQHVECVLVPCAHRHLCYTCAMTIYKSDKAICPICRHKIVGINKAC